VSRRPERLAVFDLDGTLTRTMGVDGRCYARACREVLGLARVADDWSAYRHTSDEGIARELCERERGRPAERAELAELKRRFVELLAGEAARAPELFCEVPGARETLRELPGCGWAVAVATGAWEVSARLKLEAAALPTGLPLATSDGMPERAAIVRAAIGRATALHEVLGFSRVVSVGDAVWDVRTARDLGLPFVGVHVEGGGSGLRGAGAGRVLRDYTELEEVLAALDGASRPHPPRRMPHARAGGGLTRPRRRGRGGA